MSKEARRAGKSEPSGLSRDPGAEAQADPTTQAPGLTVRLLGGAAIERKGAPIGGAPAQRHRLALLALLLVAEGHPVTRDKIIAYLWPERDTESGRNLLKVSVHQLRKALGDGAIRTTGDQLSVDPAVLHSDVAEFRDAFARGDDAAAVRTYTGPFLDGFFLKDSAEFEHWVDAERQRLRRLYERAHAKVSAPGAARRPGASYAEGLAPAAAADTPVASPRGASVSMAAGGGRATTRRSWGSRVLAALAVVAAAVLIALAGGAFARRPAAPHPTGAADAPAVAVLPFQVVGSDSAMLALRDGLADMISERFTGEGGGSARALEPSAPLAELRRAESADARPSLATALPIAAAAGADQLLRGQIVATAGQLDMSAVLYRVSDGAAIARSNVRFAARELGVAADRLVAELIVLAAGEPGDRLEDLARRPLSVVRRFVAARARYREGRYAAAESLYARALDDDSTFALAGLGLAMANSWTAISDQYGRGRDAALRGQSRLSPRDRAFVAAFFAPDPQMGRPRAPAIYQKMWEDMTEKWPDWAESWYELGDRYYHFGGLAGVADPSERARGAFRRALRLDTALAAPLHHLIEIDAARGESEPGELRALSDRYFAANPGVSRDRSAIGWEIATAQQDRAWLSRIRASLDSMPASELNRLVWVTDANGWPKGDAARALEILRRRASATNEVASAQTLTWAHLLNAGRAREASNAARGLGAAYPDRPVAALFDAYAAMLGGEDADTAQARDAAQRLESFAASPVTGDYDHRNHRYQAACLVGFWRSRTGDASGAAAIARRLHRDLTADGNGTRDGRVCAAWVDASIATEAGGKAPAMRALAHLDTLLLTERVPPSTALAAGTLIASALYERLGETRLALAAARRREHLTGHPALLAAQLRAEARLTEASGETEVLALLRRHYRALRDPR